MRLLILPNSNTNTSFSMVRVLLRHNLYAPSTFKNTLVTVFMIIFIFVITLLYQFFSFSTWFSHKKTSYQSQPPRGLEPGFEPQRVYSSLEEAHNLSGVKPPALPPPRPPRASAASRAGEDIVAGRKRSLAWWSQNVSRSEMKLETFGFWSLEFWHSRAFIHGLLDSIAFLSTAMGLQAWWFLQKSDGLIFNLVTKARFC